MDLSTKLSFEPLSHVMKNRSFIGLKTECTLKSLLKNYETYILSNSVKSWYVTLYKYKLERDFRGCADLKSCCKNVNIDSQI